MINEPHHITLTLLSTEDFEFLLTVLGSGGFKMQNVQPAKLTVECYLDDFILALIEKFLECEIIYDNRIAPVSFTPGKNLQQAVLNAKMPQLALWYRLLFYLELKFRIIFPDYYLEVIKFKTNI